VSDETYYTALGVSETATQDEIDRAYRNFIEAHHVLSDSTQRSSYDQQLAQHRQQRTPASPKAATTPTPLSVNLQFSSGCDGLDYPEGSYCLFPRYSSRPADERFEEEPIRNPWAVVASILILIGLWYLIGKAVFQ
jgi:curved DNA-binding protein CbpA